MIREVIGEDTPFYLEAMGDTAEEMIEDAHKIRQEIKGNTMIKIRRVHKASRQSVS